MTSWLDLNTFSTGNVLTKTQAELIRTNLEFLRTPPNYFYQRPFIDADYTTTSTSFVLIDGTNIACTVYSYGNPVRIRFCGALNHDTANGRIFLEILVDGAALSNAVSDGLGAHGNDTSGNPYFFEINRLVAGLAEGNHTFSIQWRTSSGTATLAVDNVIQYEVNEEY